VKVAFVVLLFAASAFAQPSNVSLPSACGSEKTSFSVKVDDTQHMLAQPEPGKALVYILRDDGALGSPTELGYPTIKIGIDGTWVGANEANSWFSVSVEPGEHGVCASPQSVLELGHIIELAHFTAEAGKTYYFRTRFTITKVQAYLNRQAYLNLDPLDSDQGKYLVAVYPLSVWRAKK